MTEIQLLSLVATCGAAGALILLVIGAVLWYASTSLRGLDPEDWE